MGSLFSGKEGSRRKGLAPALTSARSIPLTSHYPHFLDDTKLLKRYRGSTHHGSFPPQVGAWKKDKVVTLLGDEDGHLLDEEVGPSPVEEYEPDQPTFTGRISIYCTAAAYDIKGLQTHLETRGYRCQTYPEVLHSRYVLRSGVSTGDIMFFEYGVVVFWDPSNAQENSILQDTLKQFEQNALVASKVEEDTFQFRYLPYSKPYIQNDVITMSPNIRDASLLKLSISFALSQSVKLSVLEERVLRMAALTKPLPLALAREGKVKVSDTDVAKLMGRVYIEQSQLNLLGSVLDTPDFFWEQNIPDAMQAIYDRVWDYLEMENRVAVINARLDVLHEMLDMLRLQQNALHGDKMEIIIIALIVVDVFILLFQLAATLGWVGRGLVPHLGLPLLD
ncbi:hypothetical protein N2152v2_004788 [Parachlorella kessleri]